MPEPILVVECNEPKGTFLRNVYVMDLTPENMKTFWEKSSKYPTLFNQELRGDFKKFVEFFVDKDSAGVLVGRGLFWYVDDFVGVFYMTNIRPGYDAVVHFTFFDGRLKGRQPLGIAMLRYVFSTYKFRRLSVELPDYVVGYTKDYVRGLGFKFEGKRRRSSLHNGKWIDTSLYGILAEESLNG